MPRLCAIYPSYWPQLWGETASAWIYLSLCTIWVSYLTSFRILSFPLLAMDKKPFFWGSPEIRGGDILGTPHSIPYNQEQWKQNYCLLPRPPTGPDVGLRKHVLITLPRMLPVTQTFVLICLKNPVRLQESDLKIPLLRKSFLFPTFHRDIGIPMGLPWWFSFFFKKNF